mmetsp:Transcript_10348/g.29327  ORF Transcript_10348/g.29327 Transcript_10348/m.29327 type:complete len:392 (-) Transcript_10348:181-1356(-)
MMMMTMMASPSSLSSSIGLLALVPPEGLDQASCGRRRVGWLVQSLAGLGVRLGESEGLLPASGGVRGVALPQLEHARLEGPAERERELPGLGVVVPLPGEQVDLVQVHGRLLLGEAAAQEEDPREVAGQALVEHVQGRRRDLVRPRLGRAVGPRHDHLRLQQAELHVHLVLLQPPHDFLQDLGRDLPRPCHVVVARDQDLWLDDGDESLLLAYPRVPGELLRVLLDALPGGQGPRDFEGGPPLGESRSLLAVLGAPLLQSVQPLCHRLFLAQRSQALINFDPREHPLPLQDLHKRLPVLGRLQERLLVKDDPPEARPRLARHQYFSVLPPRLFHVLQVAQLRRVLQPLPQRPRALIGGQDPLASAAQVAHALRKRTLVLECHRVVWFPYCS